jgi:hypothetical protein
VSRATNQQLTKDAKMKASILALVCLLCAVSLNVYATDYSPLMKTMNGKFKAHHISAQFSVKANPPPTPIRQAIAKYKVVKITASQNPDGSYTYTPSDVCSVSTTINVYDSRASGEVDMSQADMSRVACQSTVGGSPVSINLGGIVFLYTIDWFGITQDAKFALPLVAWQSQTPTQSISIMEGDIAGSGDLLAKSYLVNYGSDNGNVCTSDPQGNTSCAPMEMESFQVAADIEDVP